MDDALIGRTLAHYRIDRRLGSGGMGVVYAAWDLRLDRRVAPKILSEKADDARRRLQQEARAAAGLSHPHITAIHSVEDAAGLAFTVMEYIEGEALSARLLRGALDKETLLKFGLQIASAVEHVGRLPFDGATGFALSAAILHDAPSPLPEQVPLPSGMRLRPASSRIPPHAASALATSAQRSRPPRCR